MFVLDAQLTKDLREVLPEWITDVRFRETVDADGESALVVFLVVDTQSKAIEDGEKLSEARRAVSAVFDKHRVAYWPYLRFVSEPDASLETR